MKNQKSKFAKTFSFLLAILTFNFFLFTCNPSKANAEGVSLKLSPSLLQIKAQAPVEIKAPLTIENLSDNSVSLKTQFKLFKGNANGQVEILSDKDNHSDIFSKIQLTEKDSPLGTLSLGPKQKKDLNLKISIPEGQISSDYYFSLIFVSQPDSTQQNPAGPSGQNSFSNLSGGIAMNIILSIGPKSSPRDEAGKASGSIEEFSSPEFLQGGPVSFNLRVKNSGAHFVSPKGTIYIRNMFGQTIGKIDLPAQNILANSTRSLTNDNSVSNSAVWPEKFLLGFYTANLSLDLSPHGPTLTKTTQFAAFPLKLGIGIALGIILFLIIYKRVKLKMK